MAILGMFKSKEEKMDDKLNAAIKEDQDFENAERETMRLREEKQRREKIREVSKLKRQAAIERAQFERERKQEAFDQSKAGKVYGTVRKVGSATAKGIGATARGFGVVGTTLGTAIQGTPSQVRKVGRRLPKRGPEKAMGYGYQPFGLSPAFEGPISQKRQGKQTKQGKRMAKGKSRRKKDEYGGFGGGLLIDMPDFGF